MLRYTVRPLSDRIWLRPTARMTTRFSASWTETLDLLERELDFIGGHDLVLEVDVQEKEIRNDGMLRANAAQAVTPVVVAFESKHGPLLYRCDRFETSYYSQGPAWQHNVRAVALTLQSLRAVDRYGATQRAEQYQGYKAIGAGAATPMPAAMTTDRAYDVLQRHSSASRDLRHASPDSHRTALHRALRTTHPDRGGRREDYDEVQAAKAHLERAGKL